MGRAGTRMPAVWVVGAALVRVTTGCGGSDAGGDTPPVELGIGALESTTGCCAGSPSRFPALDLAQQQMNQALAASNSRIRFKLDALDTMFGDLAVAENLARASAETGTVVFVSDTSAVSSRVNGLNYDAARPLGVPVVCYACTSASFHDRGAVNADPVQQVGLADAGGWLSRTVTSSQTELELLTRYLLSRGPGGDGDVDRNGVAKISMLTGGSAADAATFGRLGTIARAVQGQQTNPPSLSLERIVVDGNVSDPFATDWSPQLNLLFDGASSMEGASPVADGPPDVVMNWTPSGSLSVAFVWAYAASGYTATPMMNPSQFRRAELLTQIGDAGVGQRGVSRQAWSNDASGAAFAQAYQQLTQSQAGPYDGAAYDAMAVALLAAVKAATALPDPARVTPAQVKQAMTRLNVKSGQVIRTGVDEFKKAVAAIAAGHDIDYQGASGPVDFDNGEVKANVALYEIQKVAGALQFVETQVYDCVSDPGCPLGQ